jgi:hypothetical protein
VTVVELQVREEALVEVVKAVVNDRRLPSASIDSPFAPQVSNRPLDSIECVGCTFEQDGEGEMSANLDLLVRFYESYAVARAAGSLQRPATREDHLALRLHFRVEVGGGGARLLWAPVFAGVVDDGSLSLGDLGAGFTAVRGAVLVQDGIVCVRLGSSPSDPLTAQIVSRLDAQDDWVQTVPGEVLAATVRMSLDGAVATIADDEHVPDGAAAATYVTVALPGLPGLPSPPCVVASADVVAVDACPVFEEDITVTLSVVATFRAVGAALETTVRLSVDADSFWCAFSWGLIGGPIAAGVVSAVASDMAGNAAAGAAGPGGSELVDSDDDSITYRGLRPLALPGRFTLTRSALDDSGLILAGTLVPWRPATGGLQGWVDPPRSVLDVDCRARQVRVAFRHAVVELHDYDPPGGPPRLFPDWTRFEPADAWVAVPGKGNSWQDLVLTFADPPTGRLPVGTPTSVYLMTDCGLRWIDLGVVPPDHDEPTTADRASMISTCMALSAGWREQALSVFWLPRPPDQVRVIEPIRQWQLGFDELPGDVRLEFVALSADGVERAMGTGTSNGRRGLGVELVTAADETLVVRADSTDYQVLPIVRQRWIQPLGAVELSSEPIALAAVAGRVAVQDAEGTITLVALADDGHLNALPLDPADRAPGLDLLRSSLKRQVRRGRLPWAGAARLDDHTVAVVHRRALVVGTAGAGQQL